MRAYDFNTNFSSEEFQNFARDMIQKREGIIFESFAEGKDQGIDGRYIAEDGTTVILQAKQFKNMASEILKVMRKEKMKMDQLVRTGKRVDRYILALSENITPDKKNQIAEIMRPYICNLKDIVTKNDFNNWLSIEEYKTIEEKYQQLWYPGTDVLNRELFESVNAALLQKSRICYEKMLAEKDIFVKTETYEETIFKAQKNRTVIISGEPGVGKTTLAEQVALFYLGKYRSEIFLTVSSVLELYTALSVSGKR